MNPRLLVFIPMYNCARQVGRTIARLAGPVMDHVTEVIVVDNGSNDDGVAVAAKALARLPVPARILRNDANYGLGGSHKVAFDLAVSEGFDHVLVLHGDDQADVADILPELDRRRHIELDCLLGSRFAKNSRRVGYSLLRTAGNLAFNALFSAATLRWTTDLGSGLNCFAVSWLRDRFYLDLADDLTFNNHLLLAMAAKQARTAFFPISWREEDQVSNVRLFRQAWRTLGIPVEYAIHRRRWLKRQQARRPGGYTSTTVFTHDPARSEQRIEDGVLVGAA